MQRFITNICSNDLAKSRDFYMKLMGLEIQFESDWYLQLTHSQVDNFELGIIQRDHEMVPEHFQKPPQGVYLTFVVADVEIVYQKAQTLKAQIVQPPQDTFYGQRRMLLTDPDGLLLDISSLISE